MATYATAEEFRHFARIPESNTGNDVEIELALESASRLVEQLTGRKFSAPESASIKYGTAYWSKAWSAYVVDIPDLADTLGLVIDIDVSGDSTFTESVDPVDVKYLPLNGPTPYRKLVLPSSANVVTLPGAVRLEGNFGFPDGPPDTVKEATLLQANVFFNRRNSPYGISGSPDAGFGELRLLSQVDSHVRLMLLPYMAWWGAR